VFERRLLYRAFTRDEEDIFVLRLEITNWQESFYRLARLQRNQVADVLTLAGCTHVGNLIHLQPVHTAGVGEDQQVVVRAGHVEVFDEILLARAHAFAPVAATTLRTIGRNRGALQIPVVTDRDRYLLIGD